MNGMDKHVELITREIIIDILSGYTEVPTKDPKNSHVNERQTRR